jgi:hypothetical protein
LNKALGQRVRDTVKRIACAVGFDIVRYDGGAEYPPDFTPSRNAVIRSVKPYTMTSPERFHALIEAVMLFVAAGIFLVC